MVANGVSHGGHEQVDDASRSTADERPISSGSTAQGGTERPAAGAAAAAVAAEEELNLTGPYPNGYHFPPAHTWKEGFILGCKAFWNYFCTPLGFFVVLYGLNVVAWGGMLFLLLVGAAPAMCYPGCEDDNSPRQKWIEIDSQILNALFCVTGFGLAPWRFRDLYFLIRWRNGKNHDALRRLAGFYNGWFRLNGSEKLPAELGPNNWHEFGLEKPLTSVPLPEEKTANPPLTGVRAAPTKMWKVYFIILFNVSNTFLQCGLSGLMWGMNRFNRPPWGTGLFVALACGAGAAGGIMMFREGKRVKKVEGVPVSDKDLETLARDKEAGIIHYNNINDKHPDKKQRKKQKQKRGSQQEIDSKV